MRQKTSRKKRAKPNEKTRTEKNHRKIRREKKKPTEK